jgi:uncharacterized protein YjiS (DUF1127 family)
LKKLATSGPGTASALCRIHVLMCVWHEQTRERRELIGMPEYVLKDMGISEADAYHEARKPFWRA